MENTIARNSAFFIVLLVTAALGIARIAHAGKNLDEEASAALNALYAKTPGAKALGEKAKADRDVYGYVFGATGLMGGVSFQGLKITRLAK